MKIAETIAVADADELLIKLCSVFHLLMGPITCLLFQVHAESSLIRMGECLMPLNV